MPRSWTRTWPARSSDSPRTATAPCSSRWDGRPTGRSPRRTSRTGAHTTRWSTGNGGDRPLLAEQTVETAGGDGGADEAHHHQVGDVPEDARVEDPERQRPEQLDTVIER